MKLEEIPELKNKRYPCNISIAVSSETKQKLDALKYFHRKDTSALVRTLIEEFLVSFDKLPVTKI